MNYLFKKIDLSALIFACLILNLATTHTLAKLSDAKVAIENAEMRLAGKQTFTVRKNVNQGNIQWQVDREETGETGGAPALTKDIAQATGRTATFDLPKISEKQTVYYITAKGKNFSDTRKVQVFEANKPSSFVYKSAGNPDVRTFIVAPSSLNPKTRIIVVMSGLQRNADEYLDSWTAWCSRNDYIAVSPSFDEENWGGSRGYNLGNVFTGDEGKGELNPKSKWSFSIIEGIYQTIRHEFNIANQDFDIFGHSAGAQFIHRFLLFNPDSKVRFAVAANAGWYTLPDNNLAYSYGLKHPLLSFSKRDLMAWTNRRLIIMRGTADTSREGALRKTSEADAQGQNRFERAAFMFGRAKEINPKTRWQLIDVDGVNHDQKRMAVAAQKFLETQNIGAK